MAGLCRESVLELRVTLTVQDELDAATGHRRQQFEDRFGHLLMCQAVDKTNQRRLRRRFQAEFLCSAALQASLPLRSRAV